MRFTIIFALMTLWFAQGCKKGGSASTKNIDEIQDRDNHALLADYIRDMVSLAMKSSGVDSEIQGVTLDNFSAKAIETNLRASYGDLWFEGIYTANKLLDWAISKVSGGVPNHPLKDDLDFYVFTWNNNRGGKNHAYFSIALYPIEMMFKPVKDEMDETIVSNAVLNLMGLSVADPTNPGASKLRIYCDKYIGEYLVRHEIFFDQSGKIVQLPYKNRIKKHQKMEPSICPGGASRAPENFSVAERQMGSCLFRDVVPNGYLRMVSPLNDFSPTYFPDEVKSKSGSWRVTFLYSLEKEQSQLKKFSSTPSSSEKFEAQWKARELSSVCYIRDKQS